MAVELEITRVGSVTQDEWATEIEMVPLRARHLAPTVNGRVLPD